MDEEKRGKMSGSVMMCPWWDVGALLSVIERRQVRFHPKTDFCSFVQKENLVFRSSDCCGALGSQRLLQARKTQGLHICGCLKRDLDCHEMSLTQRTSLRALHFDLCLFRFLSPSISFSYSLSLSFNLYVCVSLSISLSFIVCLSLSLSFTCVLFVCVYRALLSDSSNMCI